MSVIQIVTMRAYSPGELDEQVNEWCKNWEIDRLDAKAHEIHPRLRPTWSATYVLKPQVFALLGENAEGAKEVVVVYLCTVEITYPNGLK